MMSTIDKTIYEIGLENRHIPEVQETIKWINRSDSQRFGSWTGEFKDIISFLAHSDTPIKDIPMEILWMGVVNLVDDGPKHTEAVNVFFGPLVNALSLKMTAGDVGGLERSAIARLSFIAGETSRNAEWVTEETREALGTLAMASVNQWLNMAEVERKHTGTTHPYNRLRTGFGSFY